MTRGEITSKVERTSAPLKKNLRRRFVLTNHNNAAAQATNKNSKLTRSQQESPNNAPAAIANAILCRLAANSRHQTPPKTIQLEGASAFGVAPASASNGERPARNPASTATVQR